jgi:hypothetical protein
MTPFYLQSFFNELIGRREYEGTWIDKLCVQFVYLPILRSKIARFVSDWNSHKIRKQKNRPNLATGQPFMNYYYPAEGIRDYGYVPNPVKLAELRNFFARYGTFCLFFSFWLP